MVNRAVIDEEYRGYSSYYFQHNLSHNHCVIGYARSYKFAQTVLGFALFWFVLALSLGTPVAIRSVHNTLNKRKESRKDKRKYKPWKTGESNLQYYVWATVMVAALVDVAIIVHDAWLIIAVVFAEHLWNMFFISAVGGFFGFLATDVVVCMIYSNSFEAFEEDFPFPHFCSSHCCSSNNEVVKNRIGWLRRAVGWLRRTAGILAVVVALQLLFVHGVYVFLGFIASPLSSTTIIIFYCTTIFCAVIFVAILLKVFSTICIFNYTRPSQTTLEAAEQTTSELEQSHHKSRKEQSNTIYIIDGSAVCTFTASEQAGLSYSNSTRGQSSTSESVRASSLERGQRRPENQQHTIEKCKSTLESIGSILVGLLMLAFVVCFGVFIFITGMLVIEHNNNGGVLVFVGSLAPSAFLSLVGYCGKKLIDIGSSNRNAGVDQPGQIMKQKPIHLIVSQVPLQVQQPPSSQPCATLQTSISQSTVEYTESPLVVSVAIEPETRFVPEVVACQEDLQVQHPSDTTSQDQVPSTPENRQMATRSQHSQSRCVGQESTQTPESNSEPQTSEAATPLAYQQGENIQLQCRSDQGNTDKATRNRHSQSKMRTNSKALTALCTPLLDDQ